MPYYDRIDVSEGIDINKTNASQECNICHCQYFLDKGFKFQPYVCNGCRDVLMLSINLGNMNILKSHGVDYWCIIKRISKSEAINLMQNIDLSEKSGTLKNMKIHFHI